MDKIAVLIPCYNEEKTIYKVVTDFKAVLPDSTIYVIIIPVIRHLNLQKKLEQL